MTIDVRSRREAPDRPQRLAEAVAALEVTVPKVPGIRAVAFDFEEKAFVRAAADHVVWARRDFARGAWAVRCHSLDSDWSSGTFWWVGCAPVDEVLEIGEALWRARGSHRPGSVTLSRSANVTAGAPHSAGEGEQRS